MQEHPALLQLIYSAIKAKRPQSSPHQSHLAYIMALLLSLLACSCIAVASAGSFYQDFNITWGDGHAKILNNGELLHSLPRPNLWLWLLSPRTNISLEGRHAAKTSPANSAGTITAYYLLSQGPTHDEINFEFHGNLSGDHYTLYTYVFTQDKGNREQQFHLWFDPTKDFHTHSILWKPRHVIFSVDGIPIRDFKNLESKEVRFPKNQPMRHYSSLWDAEDWAVRGGLVKTDWTRLHLLHHTKASEQMPTFGPLMEAQAVLRQNLQAIHLTMPG